MSDPAANGFESWLATPADDLGGVGLDWLEARRARARERVLAQGVPHAKQETWRYTSIRGLLEQEFARVDESLTALQPDDLEEMLIPGLESHRILLVNGRFAPELSTLVGLPAGARVTGLRSLLATDPDAVRDRLDRLVGEEPPLFSALSTASLDDGLVILLDEDVVLTRPIELVHLSVGMDQPRVAQPRHLVVLGAGAQARIVERYLSLGDSLYCTNSLLELWLARESALQHERIQLESPNAFHITGLYLGQDAGSRYQGINIGLGARWARTDLRVRLHGEQAECALKGLYLAGDRQLLDYHLDVEHAAPGCRSLEGFKGILYGKGRAVFDGRVFVAKDAQKTDAAMSNRNLMLSESAEVDTKPQLEINADDVKCSHGTTVGQIEPEMLFYLRSRGISAPLARRMLCLGFAEEIIQELDSEALREHVSEQVGQRLEAAPLS